MKTLILFVACLTLAFARPQADLVAPSLPTEKNAPTIPLVSTRNIHTPFEFTDLERRQNSNAHYQFDTFVEDHSNDMQMQRSETRNGLKTVGMFMSSDGFFKRITHYEADQNGFRVTGYEVIRLNQNGPVVDPNGLALVKVNAAGANYEYKLKRIPEITASPVNDFNSPVQPLSAVPSVPTPAHNELNLNVKEIENKVCY